MTICRSACQPRSAPDDDGGGRDRGDDQMSGIPPNRESLPQRGILHRPDRSMPNLPDRGRQQQGGPT